MGRRSERKKACEYKVRHPNELSANDHAVNLTFDKGKEQGHWRPYLCEFCDGYHVGREPNIKHGWSREPTDITMYNELGSRVYHHGVQENVRTRKSRVKHIQRLARKAYFHAYIRNNKRKTPLP